LEYENSFAFLLNSFAYHFRKFLERFTSALVFALHIYFLKRISLQVTFWQVLIFSEREMKMRLKYIHKHKKTNQNQMWVPL